MIDGGDGSRLSPLELERALFDVEDLLQRALVPFTLLGETARSIALEDWIKGDTVHVGVRKLDLPKTALDTITQMQPVEFTDNGFTYISHGVPVVVEVIEERLPYIENAEYVFYKASEYKVPNPIKGYVESIKLKEQPKEEVKNKVKS